MKAQPQAPGQPLFADEIILEVGQPFPFAGATDTEGNPLVVTLNTSTLGLLLAIHTNPTLDEDSHIDELVTLMMAFSLDAAVIGVVQKYGALALVVQFIDSGTMEQGFDVRQCIDLTGADPLLVDRWRLGDHRSKLTMALIDSKTGLIAAVRTTQLPALVSNSIHSYLQFVERDKLIKPHLYSLELIRARMMQLLQHESAELLGMLAMHSPQFMHIARPDTFTPLPPTPQHSQGDYSGLN